ncbi:MAG: NAD-dependent dehydratase, partial [Epsilonproteobacteria bacterium]|nr:NAD-dependent dehydratase [Campylobacterota bacterium]
NIASPYSADIQTIVRMIETITHKKAKYHLLEKGAPYGIDISKIMPLLSSAKVCFDENYIKNIISTYYH